MPTETSTNTRDGIVTYQEVETASDGTILRELTQVSRDLAFIASGAQVVSQTEKTYVYATLCGALLRSTTVVERAFRPVLTTGSETIEEATSVVGELGDVATETVTNEWNGSGLFVLRRRRTDRVKQDEPTLTPSGSDFVWSYPKPVAEQVFEEWREIQTGVWHYRRETYRLEDRLSRYGRDGEFLPAGIYRRSLIEQFSETTDKPPPTANCEVMTDNPDAAAEEEAALGPDPCDPLTDPCGGFLPSRTIEERLTDLRRLGGGRGLPIRDLVNPSQTITSPLLTVYSTGEYSAAKTLALAACAEAERVLAGPSSTRTETQPFVEPLVWADDIVRVTLTLGETQSMSVERRIYGGTGVVT